MDLKCPYCNNIFAVTPSIKGVVEKNAPLVHKVLQWIDTPVTVAELLISLDVDSLEKHEPLERTVYRTAFRATDIVRELKLNTTPEALQNILSHALTGWNRPVRPRRIFGKNGRWWVKIGYEDAPGYTEEDLI